MLSLPLLPPLPPPSHRPSPRAPSPPPLTQQPHPIPRAPHHHLSRDEHRRAFNASSPLYTLARDEASILQRKTAIATYGAQWIRPPGVPKTLQAYREEEAERVEQEEQARQEQGLLDLRARQAVEENEGVREEGEEGGGEGGEGAEGERDLDAEVPDADAPANDEEEEGEAEGESFNEDSLLLEGHSQMQLPRTPNENLDLPTEDDDAEHSLIREEAELTFLAQDEEDLGLDLSRNLDDSVPEAGSYQHTDTELEDSESELDSSSDAGALQDSFAARPRAAAGGLLRERLRGSGDRVDAIILARSPGSLNLSSSLMEIQGGDSPVVARRGGGVGRRGRGRGMS